MKVILIAFLATCIMGQSQDKPNTAALQGAWKYEADGVQTSAIFSEKYFAITRYNLQDKKFESTRGGSWKIKGNQILFTEEFNTSNQDQIGKEVTYSAEIKKAALTLTINGKQEQWTRVDDGSPGKLAGAWLITGRDVNGEIQKITPGARRTMKILSGTRFQWIAYNTETKEFFGTGGGTYKTEGGKYTEYIEFFSRNSSRVGMNLQFDFSLEDGAWRHKGLSSKGDPINEVWTKRELLGL